MKVIKFGVMVSILGLITCLPAQAAIHVMSPIVDDGEVEVELAHEHTWDSRKELNQALNNNIGVGFGVSSQWGTEFEVQWKKDMDGYVFYDSSSWENRFQLTPQGKYWADVGLFTEYERVKQQNDHHSATLGFLFQKDMGQVQSKLNLLLGHEFGNDAESGLSTEIRAQQTWKVHHAFEPGIELYAEIGKFGAFNALKNDVLRAGPVVTGLLFHSGLSKVNYEVGYLSGLNHISPKGTARAFIEYEFRF